MYEYSPRLPLILFQNTAIPSGLICDTAAIELCTKLGIQWQDKFACCEDLSGGNCYAWTLYSSSASVYETAAYVEFRRK